LWNLKKSTPKWGKLNLLIEISKKNLGPGIEAASGCPQQGISIGRAKQLRTRGRQRRTLWEDAVGSTSVHEEMPVGDLVLHVDQLPVGDGVDLPWTS
jgi:hypothetical protein